jgi:glycosyltransferase involved in cell wall biosynthesis
VKSKPKIAIIGAKGFPGFGGGARSTESLANELKDKYDITVFAIETHTNLKTGDYNGIHQIVFKGSKLKRANTLFYYIKSAYYVLVKEKFDLVHIQHIYAGLIIPIIRLRYKVVNTVRGIIPSDDNKWSSIDKVVFRFFEFLALRFSNEVVSVCDPHIEYLQKVYSRNIHYIPNGVYLNFDMLNKKQPKGYLSFSAGRIISLKGLHLLLDALKIINYSGRLLVVGSLEHVPAYKQTIFEKAEGLDVEFVGLIKDKNELFTLITNSKLFVFPSLNEGMSNMLLETASLKTPILASDIPENKAVFTDYELNFFASNNSNDLAEKLADILTNDQGINTKANLAFEKLKANHSWKNIAQQYDELYKRLLN